MKHIPNGNLYVLVHKFVGSVPVEIARSHTTLSCYPENEFGTYSRALLDGRGRRGGYRVQLSLQLHYGTKKNSENMIYLCSACLERYR